mmetsp:Transcript_24591/g.49819  ORF Transcript_24591/g.49819 Transcript_24591/m.49819 type:complete len:105 (-) Transcript_24591:356-670(-)
MYPAVNAFTSHEPGSLAPALSEMNNFIPSGSNMSSTDSSPARASPTWLGLFGSSVAKGMMRPPSVTPEMLRRDQFPRILYFQGEQDPARDAIPNQQGIAVWVCL